MATMAGLRTLPLPPSHPLVDPTTPVTVKDVEWVPIDVLVIDQHNVPNEGPRILGLDIASSSLAQVERWQSVGKGLDAFNENRRTSVFAAHIIDELISAWRGE